MLIRIKVSRAENVNYFGVTNGDIVAIDIEDYLCGVVGSEIGNASLEACKAQAIAARTYAMPYTGDGEYITDQSDKHQAFRTSRMDKDKYPNAIQGVSDTAGIVLTYGGKILKTCSYSASNGGRTVSSAERWGGERPYLIAQDDPWDAAECAERASKGQNVTKGHGVGMSQYGASWAAKNGISADKILAFYYPGAELKSNYGEGGIGMEILTCYQTANRCYQKGRKASHVGILVHSTGANNRNIKRYVYAPDRLGVNANGNHWNKAEADKCMHAFIGLDANGEVIVANTLPYEYACWGCGKGNKGSYNYDPTAHLQFEICQGSATDEAYYRKAVGVAEEYCAYLCRRFGFTSADICSHREAALAGYASNHGDPESWMRNFGDNMDMFRARVAAILGEPAKEPVIGQAPASPTPSKLGDRTLRHGDKGDDVKELQAALAALGYDLGSFGANKDGIDGSFGPATETAVGRFQEDNALAVDGIAGRQTFAALAQAKPATEQPPVRYRLILTGSEDDMKAMQAAYGGTLEVIT
ncbi:MAG: SpoIID/LytB domain-containing protein [Eubacteriales bacterium]|nr:SpoIID/LytB domain-containing protein [Eubacteriales bacterium]MDD3881873.1 SpoIID/LytB domain-containing protein [Eubacteriales bacterium]MDD4512881.1 SpoIID/LytB domain-containing protein [Eubacteriales bacterium]